MKIIFTINLPRSWFSSCCFTRFFASRVFFFSGRVPLFGKTERMAHGVLGLVHGSSSSAAFPKSDRFASHIVLTKSILKDQNEKNEKASSRLLYIIYTRITVKTYPFPPISVDSASGPVTNDRVPSPGSGLFAKGQSGAKGLSQTTGVLSSKIAGQNSKKFIGPNHSKEINKLT